MTPPVLTGFSYGMAACMVAVYCLFKQKRWTDGTRVSMRYSGGRMRKGYMKSGAGTFRALYSRNYRLYFSGQAVSLTGTWMQTLAMSWLVYRLTNSVFLLGLVGFAGQIPALILTPFAGVAADRLNRHHIIVATQVFSMLQAAILAGLTLTHHIAIWHVLSLSLFMGIINAFDAPARQSFVVQMVDKREDLPNAIALNSTLFNGARLVGPSLAGVLVAWLGEGMCFLFNAVSYVAVILALLAMRLPAYQSKPMTSDLWQDFRDGVSYVYHHQMIRRVVLLLAMISLTGMSHIVLMPVVARDILHGGPHTLGFLMGASGIGAVSAALLLASRNSTTGLENWIRTAPIVMGTGLAAVAVIRHIVPMMLIMLIVGFGMMLQMASSNTYVQATVEDNKRGRVMSLYVIAFMGVMPFGQLLAGALGQYIGVPWTLTVIGIICIVSPLAVFGIRGGNTPESLDENH